MVDIAYVPHYFAKVIINPRSLDYFCSVCSNSLHPPTYYSHLHICRTSTLVIIISVDDFVIEKAESS